MNGQRRIHVEKFNSLSIRCVKNIKSLQSRSSSDPPLGLSGLLVGASSLALFGLVKVRKMLILGDISSLTAKNAEFLVKRKIP